MEWKQHDSCSVFFSNWTLLCLITGSLLIEHAAWEKSASSLQAAKVWCQQPLNFLTPDQYVADNNALVMEGYNTTEVYGPLF